MNNMALDLIKKHSTNGILVREAFFTGYAEYINSLSIIMAYTIAKGGKILLCGNGGSAGDCQHIAAEFVNRFLIDRPPLPAIALTTDSSILSSIANDFGFDEVFSKQILALGQKNDILIIISTSGASKNVLMACQAAHEKGITTIAFTGKDGGALGKMTQYNLHVASNSTPIIQEIHIAVGHVLCALVDYYLFENVTELSQYLEGKKPLPTPQN